MNTVAGMLDLLFRISIGIGSCHGGTKLNASNIPMYR